MSNLTTLMTFAVSGIAGAQSESSSRQSPFSPYFDAVVYPHAWGWPIAAFVVIVLKTALLFGAFVVYSFSDIQLLKNKANARSTAELNRWTNAMLDLLNIEPEKECRDKLICEAEVSIRNNPLLRVIAYDEGENAHRMLDCGGTELRKRCALTVGDLLLQKLGWFGT
ncbi:uncharacterized protein LOC131434382 [Malaya genurostris]|uniref:uncharacterized protein LOC131434382 n=1 Tax=Malaya genurostris TaxID=325434 RepID=UPI0026F3D5D4|nr:uncharacterized protein LOC131434382 [Malaya genurostris]